MPATKEKVVLEAPAKINLSLEVLGKRSDGYHSIRSILVPITLHDTVTLTPGGRKFAFHGGQGAPKDDTNLAWKAVKILTRETGVRHGLKVRVVKRIPIAAGMGGGSSDAAAVLRGVNDLWELGLSDRKLEKLGLEIGSDVPYFLRGGACYAGGRGEELEVLPNAAVAELVILHPHLKVTSQWAYENIIEELTTLGGSASMVKVALASGRVELLASHLVNHLESGVLKAHAVVREAKKKLMSAGALGALMSGSGPTVFGIAPDAETADRMAKKLEGPKWKVIRAATAA
ncbi:MAG: 4-(cytidine 5'-diphospho)-2-C-methyl-D-erythritol kinase [Gemmatimonadetes bacterium]|nr:4-(cytidine 5'-diphospho)-2-C-methyl-D-erythritol kinase [Gemmatimonadota bacterium]